MNTNQVRLFDHNNKLVPNFDEEIEKILISVHGEKYYDTDEALIDTNCIPIKDIISDQYEENELDKTIEIVDEMVGNKTMKINIVNSTSKTPISIKDFLPVLFFIAIFSIIVIAGYYFLNTVDLMNLIKR